MHPGSQIALQFSRSMMFLMLSEPNYFYLSTRVFTIIKRKEEKNNENFNAR
jgi:hypothetical protein